MPRERVFVSYSHRDRRHLDRLHVHIKPLVRNGLIDLWDDTRLEAGSVSKREIEAAMASAKVAVLLVSADFLASNFIADNELPSLLDRARDDGAIIIPVIVGACRFVETPALSRFQAMNDPSKPLAALPAAERERVWVRLSSAIEAGFVNRSSEEGWAVANEKAVAQALNELLVSSPGSFLIVSSGDAYVQFMLGDEGVDCEAVSNNYLPPTRQLTDEAQAKLDAYGFARPQEALRNFEKHYLTKALVSRVAGVASSVIQVLRDVYDVSNNEDLVIRLERHDA